MNTIAVIVTHNRLALLREAVEAVHRQSSPVQGIVVINNGSTDGTREWLDAQPGLFAFTRPISEDHMVSQKESNRRTGNKPTGSG